MIRSAETTDIEVIAFLKYKMFQEIHIEHILCDHFLEKSNRLARPLRLYL